MGSRGHRAGPPVRLIRLGPSDPGRSQAVYHALAEGMTVHSPDTVILTQPDSPYLCVGYHQPLDTVLDRAECARLGLPILRRRVGGGATYLDSNQLFYQFVFHHSRMPANFKACYELTLATPVATLRRLGLAGELRDVNEVEVGGRRIAGIGGGRIGEANVVVGNFLFDFDYDAMAAVWQVPWPSFRTLARQALQQCVTTFRKEAGAISADEVNAVFAELLPEILERPVEQGQLSDEEERLAGKVAARLGSRNYLDLHADAHRGPMQSLKVSSRGHIHAHTHSLSTGQIQASLYVHDGVISTALLESLPPRDWRETERRMQGLPLADWASVLEPSAPRGGAG